MIGVPLTSSTLVAGRLDALLSIAQMPPGVPVACLRGRGQRAQCCGSRPARYSSWRRPPLRLSRSARSRARPAGRVRPRRDARLPPPTIARYTAEIGAVWTDEARFGAMRRWKSPLPRRSTARPLKTSAAIRAPGHGRRDRRAREAARPRHGGVRRRRLRRPGGPLDPLRDDVLRRRRHWARVHLKRAGTILVPAVRTLAWSWRRRRAATRTRCASAAPMACQPTSSSAQARGLRDGYRSHNGLARAFEQIMGGHGRGRDVRPRSGRTAMRRGCWRRLELTPETVSTQVVPRDRHAELLSAPDPRRSARSRSAARRGGRAGRPGWRPSRA